MRFAQAAKRSRPKERWVTAMGSHVVKVRREDRAAFGFAVHAVGML